MIETVLTSNKDLSIMDMASIVSKVRFYECDLRLTKGDKRIQANTMLAIDELDIHKGDKIEIRILGRELKDEGNILDHLQLVFSGGYRYDKD
jgi:phosphotransferase system HPr-like phosphotransfer protein